MLKRRFKTKLCNELHRGRTIWSKGTSTRFDNESNSNYMITHANTSKCNVYTPLQSTMQLIIISNARMLIYNFASFTFSNIVHFNYILRKSWVYRWFLEINKNLSRCRSFISCFFPSSYSFLSHAVFVSRRTCQSRRIVNNLSTHNMKKNWIFLIYFTHIMRILNYKLLCNARTCHRWPILRFVSRIWFTSQRIISLSEEHSRYAFIYMYRCICIDKIILNNLFWKRKII